ncbi:MAG: UrcA family protein [Pseudomonadota bacterium]
MTLGKSLTLATVSLALAASAHAATNFTFDYSFDRERLSTANGAEQVLDELETRIEAECGHSMLTNRLPFAKRLSEQCVAESLEKAVASIDAPHLNAAFEARVDDRA